MAQLINGFHAPVPSRELDTEDTAAVSQSVPYTAGPAGSFGAVSVSLSACLAGWLAPPCLLFTELFGFVVVVLGWCLSIASICACFPCYLYLCALTATFNSVQRQFWRQRAAEAVTD